jgi:hypothetical protein
MGIRSESEKQELESAPIPAPPEAAVAADPIIVGGMGLLAAIAAFFFHGRGRGSS